MMKLLRILILLMTPLVSNAQYCDPDTDPDRREVDTTVNSITDYFLHGHINGHIRNYFMTTINNGYLDDHYANATGGSIAYSTASWKGIHFGVKGIFTYNLLSSDIAGADSLTRPAKWEQELFDVLHPEKTDDLDRLEELYIAYEHEKIDARVGKIDINKGPLLRRRDGRMKPFVYKGLWSDYKPTKNLHLYNGFITGVSPRGMTEWFDLNEAIGILNNGYLNDSTAYEYHEKSESGGLLVNGITSRLGKNVEIEVWNYYLHHIYNTSWFQTDYKFKKFQFGLQYVLQIPDPHQKELLEHERYFDPSHLSNTVSGQIKYVPNEHFQIRTAYLSFIGDGRFVFPKEISRESFYTSIQRSWLDGLGKSSVYLFNVNYRPVKKMKEDFQIDFIVQHVDNPGHSFYDHNKYGNPDYTQFNLAARYYFHGKLEGLHLNFLYVSRYSILPDELTFEQQYYKTNLGHFNLVVDVVF